MSGGLWHSPAEARMAFLLLSPLSSLPPAGRTWLGFTIKSGVGGNFALGRSVTIHLLGQATHLTDGETEAWGGESQTKELYLEILLE